MPHFALPYLGMPGLGQGIADIPNPVSGIMHPVSGIEKLDIGAKILSHTSM
jgi:hypothetical protein